MLNAVYRLVAPHRIEVEFANIQLNPDKVIVRPTFLSICHADQRYYQGTRPADVLAKKLPMALIHEGIGNVVYDGTGTYPAGTQVVMIPNTPVEKDEVIHENYLRSSKFRASGFDGFMQEYVELDPDRLVVLPEGIDRCVGAFTELVSVSVHALSRFDRFAHRRRERIGIWGDGNLAFITAVLLKYKFPGSELVIFGTHDYKLADFSFADETWLVQAIPGDVLVDHAFECVGGEGSEKAINQIIDHIRPEGAVSLLGVSENNVPINTRMVLEKGLQLFGSSRSGREDFLETVRMYQENPDLVLYLKSIVGEKFDIRSIDDMKQAFDWDRQKHSGKTILRWKK